MSFAEILNEVEDAFQDFEHELNPSDIKQFQLTRLEDVCKAVQIIEREREQQGRLANLKRMENLLTKLKPLEHVLHNIRPDEPSSCYIWAPIKCMLQIADGSDASFKKLLSAYALLSSHLPLWKKLPEQDQINKYDLDTMAYVLVDILRFHQHLYRILRRGGWSILFDSAWKPFLYHLDNISQRLKQCGEAISGKLDDEEWTRFRHEREMLLTQQAHEQQKKDDLQLRSCIAWLELSTQEQEQQSLFDRRADAREPDTCEWILTHSRFKSWLDLDHSRSYLWLKGKPGSGKTTLTTFIVNHAKLPTGSILLYCLCTHEFIEKQTDPCLFALRAIVAQILRKCPLLVPFVYETYVRKAELPSIRIMPTILRSLLLCLPSSYIIVDGLDECDSENQRQMLAKLDILLLPRKDEVPQRPQVKILICSRDTKGTPSRLKDEPTISLTKEDIHVSTDICKYTKNNIKLLYDRFDVHAVDQVADDIVDKAKGMFLWVRLVLSILLEQQSLHDLCTTVKQLPAGLTGVYVAIMKRLEEISDERAKCRIRTIFNWLAFCRRPLYASELCDALVFEERNQSLNKRTVLSKGVLELCKPLIEEHSDSTVAFVHFSVQEFLLHRVSGPFLEEWKAERAISISCFRYLRTCEDFFDEYGTAKSYGQIIQCLHTLFPYVNEFWEAHLATCWTNKPPVEEQQVSHEYGDVVVQGGALIQGDQYFISLASQATSPSRSNLCVDALGLSDTITRITKVQASRPSSLQWLFGNVFNDKSCSQDRADNRSAQPLQMSQTSLSTNQQFPDIKSPSEMIMEHRHRGSIRRTTACERIINTVEDVWTLLQQKVDTLPPFEPLSNNPIAKAYLNFQKQFEDIIGGSCPFSWNDMDVSQEEVQGFFLALCKSCLHVPTERLSSIQFGFR